MVLSLLVSLADGSTDTAVKDQEEIFASYFDPNPANEERVKVITIFVSMIDGNNTDAPGILKSMDQAFESNDISVEVLRQKTFILELMGRLLTEQSRIG